MRRVFHPDFIRPLRLNDFPPARHVPEKGPGDDPELEEHAGPPDPRVVAETVDTVPGEDGDGAGVYREGYVDVATVVCGTDEGAYLVEEDVFGAVGDCAFEGEA